MMVLCAMAFRAAPTKATMPRPSMWSTMLRWVFALVAACCVASGKEHDFYKLLKLGRRFTEKELKAAYREAREAHRERRAA